MSDEYINADQLSALTGIARATLYKYARNRTMPASCRLRWGGRVLSHHVLFHRERALAWFAQRQLDVITKLAQRA